MMTENQHLVLQHARQETDNDSNPRDGESADETPPRGTTELLLRRFDNMEIIHRREISAYQKELKKQQKYMRYMILFVLATSILLVLCIKIQADRQLKEATMLKGMAMEDLHRHDKELSWYLGRFTVKRLAVAGVTGFALGYSIKKAVEYVAKCHPAIRVVTEVYMAVPAARAYLPVAVASAHSLAAAARQQLLGA